MTSKPTSLLRCAVLSVVMVLGYTQTVQACGESRFRLGHGIKYKARQVPLPAQLLVYESAQFGDKAAELEAVGHQVTVVTSHQALLQAASGDAFDVVIAPYADLQSLQAEISGRQGAPDLLPMVGGASDEKRAARREFSRVIDSRANFKKVARAVHKIMQTRGQ